jgi:hypothetical protein
MYWIISSYHSMSLRNAGCWMPACPVHMHSQTEILNDWSFLTFASEEWSWENWNHPAHATLRCILCVPGISPMVTLRTIIQQPISHAALIYAPKRTLIVNLAMYKHSHQMWYGSSPWMQMHNHLNQMCHSCEGGQKLRIYIQTCKREMQAELIPCFSSYALFFANGSW